MATKDKFAGQKAADLAKMTQTQFRALNARDRALLVTKLSSAANKRVRRQRDAGMISTASVRVLRDGMFSARGKSGKMLEAEFARLKEYFLDEGGTLRGARREIERRKDMIPPEYRDDDDENTMDAAQAAQELIAYYWDYAVKMLGYDSKQFVDEIYDYVEASPTGKVNILLAMEHFFDKFAAEFDQRKNEAEAPFTNGDASPMIYTTPFDLL